MTTRELVDVGVQLAAYPYVRTSCVDSKAKLSPNNNMKIDDVHEEA